MPVYEDPIHGVSMSEAVLEAAAIARVGIAMLDCFVLSHPAELADRYIVNNHENFTAMLADGITEAEFLAYPVRLTRAVESPDAASPEITLELDNISGAISDMLRRIRGDLRPLVIENYLYASDDPSGPAIMPPERMEIHTIYIDETTARLTGSFGDAGNKAIPALTFKRDEYPGLVR